MACAEFYQQINPDSILLLSMAACFQGLAETLALDAYSII